MTTTVYESTLPAPPLPDLAEYLAIRAHALEFPEAWEDYPWGERVIKVRKKIFAFLGTGTEAHALTLSVKLPSSQQLALTFEHASPTSHGLGRSKWVTLRFAPDDEIPVAFLCAAIDESYRAVAPKTLVRKLGDAPDIEDTL